MIATKEATSILSKHKIRVTTSRGLILDQFLQKREVLSQPELEKRCGSGMDRVTIYRTLSLYMEKGILHQVLDGAGAKKYALCPDSCTNNSHAHNHAHFKCEKCGEMQCLDEISVPALTLPEGFQAREAFLLIEGRCDRCAD